MICTKLFCPLPVTLDYFLPEHHKNTESCRITSESQDTKVDRPNVDSEEFNFYSPCLIIYCRLLIVSSSSSKSVCRVHRLMRPGPESSTDHTLHSGF